MEPKLDTLKQLITLLGQNVSKDDFVQSFKSAITFITRYLASVTDKVNAHIADSNTRIDAKLASLRQPSDGYTPVKGKDYFDGKPGDNGTTPDEETLTALIKRYLPEPGPELELEPISPESIRNLLESLNGPDRYKISIDDVEGLQETLARLITRIEKMALVYVGAGAAASSGSSTPFMGSQEKSTTAPDNSQTTFAFAHTPTLIYWNGALQTLTDDYTISGLNITFTASAGVPQTGDKITNVYA